jgi:TPR repeat protein
MTKAKIKENNMKNKMLSYVFLGSVCLMEISGANQLEFQGEESEKNNSLTSNNTALTMKNSPPIQKIKIPLTELLQGTPQELSKLSQQVISQYPPEDLEEIYKYGWANRYKQNFAQAAALYRIASLGGNRDAQSQYAEMLFQGLGVKENKKEAFRWAYKAAQNGDLEMASSLCSYVQEGTLAMRFELTDAEEEMYEAKIIRLINKLRGEL